MYDSYNLRSDQGASVIASWYWEIGLSFYGAFLERVSKFRCKPVKVAKLDWRSGNYSAGYKKLGFLY